MATHPDAGNKGRPDKTPSGSPQANPHEQLDIEPVELDEEILAALNESATEASSLQSEVVEEIAEVEVGEEVHDVMDEEPTFLEDEPPSGSAINLGSKRSPSSPSTGGQHSMDWANLVGSPPSSHPTTPPKFDSPSDADVLDNVSEILDEDALAEPTPRPATPESSRVDLSEPAPRKDPFRSDLREELNAPSGDSGILLNEDDVIAEEDIDFANLEESAPTLTQDSMADLAVGVDIAEGASDSLQVASNPQVEGEDSGIVIDDVLIEEETAEEQLEEIAELDESALTEEDAVVVDHPIVVGGAEGSSSAVNLGETVEGEAYVEDLLLEETAPAEQPGSPSEDPNEDAFDMLQEPDGPIEVIEDHHEQGLEDYLGEQQPSSGGTGNVQLGGVAVHSEDSAEGTLEDHGSDLDEDAAAALLEGGAADEGEGLLAGEEALHADEVVEEAAEEETEARASSRPRTPEKARKGGGGLLGWIGGTVVGTGIGAAACVGLWFAGLVPGTSTPKTQPTIPQTRQTPVGSVTRDISIGQMVRDGDLAEAPPPIDENDAEQLAERGQFRWLKYLQTQLKDNKPLNIQDEDVKLAWGDFDKANAAKNPVALYWMGHIQEMTNQLPQARQTYQKGLQEFQQDPARRALFQAGLDRLDLRAGAAAVPGPQTRLFDDEQLVLILLALQAPAEQPGAGTPAEVPEAGTSFWQALKFARQQKYTEALKALGEAKKNHALRRITHLRKAQNPLSDPTEEIFLQSCDELQVYWLLQDRLRAGGYLAANNKDPLKAIDKALADLAQTRTEVKTLQTANMTLQTANTQLTVENKKADAMVKTLTTQVEDGKKATLAAMDLVKDRDAKLKALDGELKAAAAKQKATENKLVLTEMQLAQRETARKGLETTLGDIITRLEKGGILPPKAKPSDILKGIDDAISLARMKDPKGEVAAARMEAQLARTQLQQRWTPAEMLKFWQAVLEDRRHQALATQALVDVKRVSSDQATPAAAKAQALFVEGLALRNQGKYDEARTKVQEAIKLDVAGKESWKPQADQILKDLTDPASYYLPQAKQLLAQRNFDGAIAVLNEASQIFPGSRGTLLTLRSAAHLAAARQQAKGKLALTTPHMKEAQQDATDALAAGATAEAHHAAGQVAEALGQQNVAVQQYRKAVELHGTKDLTGARYQADLARVLYGADIATTRLPVDPRQLAQLTPVEWMVLLLVTAQAPDNIPAADKGLVEALQLADELLARPDIDQMPMVKAQALILKGQWTPALQNYALGLQPALSREQGEGLLALVRRNPALKQTDPKRTLIVGDAEKDYARGLQRYFARRYAEAEKEFARAVDGNDQDARYYYFLGLARLAQNKPGVMEAFNQGAKLQLANKPPSATVYDSLERIQGSPRRLIDQALERNR